MTKPAAQSEGKGSGGRRSASPVAVLAAFVGGVIVVFVGISFAQEVQRRVALQQHVRALQEDIAERERRIATLEQLTEYLNTDAYRERAAREKLNYQRPEEHVVVIPERGTVLGSEEQQGAATSSVARPIPYQWWDRIFVPGG